MISPNSHTSRLLRAIPVIGAFLLLLGLGNLSIGYYKGLEYESMLKNLSSAEAASEVTNAFPLRRVQQTKTTRDLLYARREKAQARIELYNLVKTGGKIFLLLGTLLIAIAFLVRPH
ncbi:MAG: hypothetical protein IT291_03645 [Deltaproteobacteria bacterium]|nr:hypothetical protein [Deltaproteobacteria bacterium]